MNEKHNILRLLYAISLACYVLSLIYVLAKRMYFEGPEYGIIFNSEFHITLYALIVSMSFRQYMRITYLSLLPYRNGLPPRPAINYCLSFNGVMGGIVLILIDFTQGVIIGYMLIYSLSIMALNIMALFSVDHDRIKRNHYGKGLPHWLLTIAIDILLIIIILLSIFGQEIVRNILTNSILTMHILMSIIIFEFFEVHKKLICRDIGKAIKNSF